MSIPVPLIPTTFGAFIGSLVTEIRAGSVWWDQDSRSIQLRQGDETRLAELGLH